MSLTPKESEEEETGVCDEETGVCDEEEETGVCDEETGVCDEETGVCDDETGVCDEETGVCDDETGVCDDETGVCDEEDGGDIMCTPKPISALISGARGDSSVVKYSITATPGYDTCTLTRADKTNCI